MSILTANVVRTSDLDSGLPASDALYEEVEGRRVELPPMGTYAEFVTSRLFGLLFGLLEGQKVGSLTMEMLFVLDAENGPKRRPDIAFVSHARWPEGKPIPSVGVWDVMPDLVVEVVSPTDLDLEVTAKLHEYFRHGVRQVWQIRPIEGLVSIYDSPTSVRIHERSETIDCGTILANVRLSLNSVFPEMGK